MGMGLIGPLPKSKQAQVNALVIQDYFAKWPEGIPLNDATAKSVAGVLLLVILTWGPPAQLLSDQGPEFVAELNCQKSTTPKLTDRFNRKLKAMIAKFVNGRQDNWEVYLPAFLYTYRMSQHKSTGHTPYKSILGEDHQEKMEWQQS